MFDYICIIWLYPIKMIERDSVWLDLIPSFQYSTWLKMQNITQTACHLNFLNGMVLHMVIWWCGISTPTYHWAKSLNCSRDQEHSQRGFGPGHVGLHQNKLYSRIQWGVFPFSCNIFANPLQKIPSIWMQREGPTVQESCKINMNVGLAPHLATSKLKILRGLCQGSWGWTHDLQLFQNWFSSTVNPIHQKASISSWSSLCK